MSELSPLNGLPHLEELDLSGTKVADVSPLAGMPCLRNLDLSRTEVTDVSSLADLKELTILVLQGTQVTDMSPLARLPKLEQLVAGRNVEISSLAGLTRLIHLGLPRSFATKETLDQVKKLLPNCKVEGY